MKIRRALHLVDQPELDLGLSPSAEPSLRAAFQATALPRLGYTYDRALRIPAIRICLTRVAHHMAAAGAA